MSLSMFMYAVEKGVVIPRPPQPHAAKYPWRIMEIGDSFFLPHADRRAITSPLRCARKYGQFTTRRVREHGIDGLRVWRIA